MSEKLRKFTLEYDEKREDWALQEDVSDRVVRRFETKEEATEGGVLKSALGQQGGSVKIQKRDGHYQEERTFPRSRDPRESKG